MTNNHMRLLTEQELHDIMEVISLLLSGIGLKSILLSMSRMTLKLVLTEGLETLLQSENSFSRHTKARCS